jgi:hypothetical protein
MSPTTAQFGLRASIRNSTNFGNSGLNFSTNSSNNSSGQYGGQINPNSNANNSMNNDSMKGNSPMLSPKPNKETA